MEPQRRGIVGVVAFSLLLAAPAAAEVMDWEPTLQEIWGAGLFWSVAGFFLGRVHRLLGLLLLIGPAFWFTSSIRVLPDIYDPSIGPDILAATGWPYILQAHLANAVVLLAYLGGVASKGFWPLFPPGPATGVTVAVASGAAIAAWSVDLALGYAGDITASCGTTARWVEADLGLVPILLVIPLGGWLMAWRAGYAVSVARCAALSVLAGWITVMAFIEWA